jgi:hypothetical protein
MALTLSCLHGIASNAIYLHAEGGLSRLNNVDVYDILLALLIGLTP